MLLCTIRVRRAAAVVLMALLTHAAPALAQGTSFLADVDDLPLAPGLVEDADSRVAFDKPEGRIVQALASGPADPATVRAFYDATLPGLGWRAGAAGEWVRGRETLQVRVAPANGGVVVRFAIAPGAAP